MRTPPHSFLVLSILLLSPSAQAVSLLVAPDDDARGRVDADRTSVSATIHVDGNDVTAPERPGRGLGVKVVTPVGAEVATAPRRAEVADSAARVDAGDGNVSTRHTRWLTLEVQAASAPGAVPVGVRLEADGADALQRSSGAAPLLRAPSVREPAPRLALAPAPHSADAPAPAPTLPHANGSDEAPAPGREGAAPRAAPATDPRPTTAPPALQEPDSLLRAAAIAAGVALLALVPWALYHRLVGADPARAPTRSRILALLHERPGLGAAETARILALDPTTARYHLRRLAREGLAIEHGPAARPRYFAAGSVAPAERARHCATDARRRVLDAVAATPGLTPTLLARGLALARPTVSWHVGRLARDGLVVVERAGREVRVRPARA